MSGNVDNDINVRLYANEAVRRYPAISRGMPL